MAHGVRGDRRCSRGETIVTSPDGVKNGSKMAHGAVARTPVPMKLLIAIPAFNEEASIQRTIERCLHARQEIIDGSPVTHVEITVVSDGSTDRTVELAGRFGDPKIFE